MKLPISLGLVLVVAALSAVALATPPAPVIVTVNANGTFTPSALDIDHGTTVTFQRNGPSFETTDAIVQIGVPNTLSLAQICGAAAGGPTTAVVNGTELYGPKRRGVSGIYALSPQGHGFIETNATNLAADCNTVLDPTNDRNVQYGTVGSEVVGNRRHLLCNKRVFVDGEWVGASEGNQGRILQVTDSVWSNPDIDGVLLRVRWSDFQYDDNGTLVTNWTDIDREVRKAIARGKLVSINIHAGEDTPPWIFTDYDRDPNTAGLQQLAESNVAPILLRDYPSDPDVPNTCGSAFKLGSPAEGNYLSKIKGLYQTIAAHFKQDARFYQALGYVKVGGLNLTTGEARLPKRCHDPDAAPTPGACLCNTEIWATHGYTPSGLHTYYNEVENQILTSFFGQKSTQYMLIQDGFPRVLDANNFFRDPGHRDGPEGAGYPGPFAQTVTNLEYGRKGRFLQPGDPATLADDTNTGKLFASQHSGLQRLPRDQGVAGDCAQIVEHVLAVDGAGKQYFEHSSIAGVPATISNLHGCPNEWAAREGYRDQLIGFQTMNDITEPADVDSTLWNMTANSNSAYYEIYEDAAWRIGKRFGTGSSAAVLDTSGHYPSMGAAFQKNLHRWGEQLHARRKAIAVQLAAFSNAADPFTADYSHTFDAPLPVGQTATYYFINPGRCSSAPVLNQAYGRIVVHNEL